MFKQEIPNATSVQSVNYVYNGNPITFRVNGNVMVSATNMAKPFEKQPIQWLRYEQSQEFLSALSKLRNHSLADLVQVKKGGTNPGTWFHEDVALEFARWLSPAFAIWCNDRIKEILTGRTFSFPAEMKPTNCAVLTCRTADGESKQAYLFWGDDKWFRCDKWNGDREILMSSMLRQIGDYDKEVIQYERNAYFLKNGTWKESALIYPIIDKQPTEESAVDRCKKSIENYNLAKEEVRLSAKELVKFMSEKF